MSPDQPSAVDETTHTDGALLSTAAEADLEPASATHATSGSEHPPGHVAPEEAASAGGASGQGARREANPS
jgi:hypothetical protein